jgi:hypothetical protein
MMEEVEHSDEVSIACSMQRSSVASSTINDEKEWDFTCDSGQQNYLTDDVKATAVTKKRLACNYFQWCFDKMFHP